MPIFFRKRRQVFRKTRACFFIFCTKNQEILLVYSEPVDVCPAAVVGRDGWTCAEGSYLGTDPFAFLHLKFFSELMELLPVGAGSAGTSLPGRVRLRSC